MQRLNNFLENHAPEVVIVGFLLLVGGYVLLTGLLRPSAPETGAQGQPVPTASLSGSPDGTGTESHEGGRQGGSVASETVREYRGPQNRIIRETVREQVPGERITAIQTVVAAGPARRGQFTARETVVVTARETLVGPGQTVTVQVPVTETVPGPTTTKTVTVPGPDLPTTVTVTASP